jgi:hypothetical protein
MPRPVRGVLAVEGTQTGDGRFIVPGATEWPDPPLPLALQLVNEDGHDGAVQVGTIDTVTRGANGDIEFTGTVDDGQPDGAEAIRRMDASAGPMGPRFGVSIDPDDFEVELVDTGTTGPDPGAPPVVAAAGDGDPVGDVVATDAADMLVERYTRLRIRGATLLSIGAIAEAYCELADATPASDVPPVVPAADVAVPAVAAAASCSCGGTPPARPAAWFEDPQLDGPTPLTISDDGRVFGHLAAPWGACHTGIGDRCVTPPRSTAGYAYFTTGSVQTTDGPRRVGQLTMNTGHAPLAFDHRAAAAHYDGGPGALQWADVAVGEDRHGIWVAGAVRPGLTDAQLHEARAQALSGDWRNIGGALELVAALSVPVPGFPVVSLAASGTPNMQARVSHGTVTALVAAGVVAPPPPWQADLDRIEARLAARYDARIEMLTAAVTPLMPLAADTIIASVETKTAHSDA